MYDARPRKRVSSFKKHNKIVGNNNIIIANLSRVSNTLFILYVILHMLIIGEQNAVNAKDNLSLIQSTISFEIFHRLILIHSSLYATSVETYSTITTVYCNFHAKTMKNRGR